MPRARSTRSGPAEHAAGVGEGLQRHAVPGGEGLVVARGLRPPLARGEQRRAHGLEPRRRLGRVDAGRLGGLLHARDHGEHRRALEVAPVGDAPARCRERAVGGVGEDGGDLLRRPDEGQPLVPLRVGVLRRGQAALGQQQLALQVAERRLHDVAVARVARRHVAGQVRAGQERVVVEHLLEVRHEPDAVDGVAVEAPAELVVDAAVGHAVERDQGHLRRPRAGPPVPHAEQRREQRRRRELGRAAEAALLVVEDPLEVAEAGLDEVGGQRLRRGGPRRAAAQVLGDLRRLLADARGVAAPDVRERRRAPGGSSPCRGAARAGSTCRRRRASRRAPGRPSSASRRARC